MQKGFTPILILAGVTIIVIAVGGAFYLGTTISQPKSSPAPMITPSDSTRQPSYTIQPTLSPYEIEITPSASTLTPGQALKATYPASPTEEDSNWQTYKNKQQSVQFRYPENYIIDTITETDPKSCNFLYEYDNPRTCLLTIKFLITNVENEYIPHAYFYLLNSIEAVRISGQISEIKFYPSRKKWFLSYPFQEDQLLTIWDYVESGQEIIKGSTGGSHSSSNYYLIPDYQRDIIAIFAIPQSYRLRCDSINDTAQQKQCNNFYKSIIQKYNQGQMTVDTWLPENYIETLYKEAEIMIKSFSFSDD